MKKILATGALAAVMISAMPALAAEGDMQSFSYAVGTDCVYISGEVQVAETADVLWGFYDNGALIKMEKHSSDDDFSNVKVSLTYMPENFEVKSFLWTADGNMTPLTVKEEPQKAGNVVSFDAGMISEETLSTGIYSSKEIKVYMSEESSSTERYRLSEGFDFIINGVKLSSVDDDIMNEYLINNSNSAAKVDLVDSNSDGLYDCVSTEYYATAVVNHTNKKFGNNIYFKAYSDDASSSLQWYPEDGDVQVTITKNGEKISFDDIKEYDVLSIAYDVEYGFGNSSFYNIIVTDDIVMGTVDAINSANGTISVDDTVYKVNTSLTNLRDIELAGEYAFYLDAYGYIAYAEEIDNNKYIGIMLGMYYSETEDASMIEFMTPYGGIFTYPCKDEKTAADFYRFATGSDSYDKNNTVTKSDVVANIQNMVFEYTSAINKISFCNSLTPNGGAELEYTASTNKLDSYALNNTVTKLLYMGNYLNGYENAVNIETSHLVDGEKYTAYLYAPNSDNDYRFCIFLEGVEQITAQTSIAVVQSTPKTVDIDGSQYYQLEVAKDGYENVLVNVVSEEANSVSEGDIVIYAVNAEGIAVDFATVMKADQSYANFSRNSIDKFSGMINTISEDNVWNWSSKSGEAKAYFGPVYKKSNNVLELFARKTDGLSSIYDDIEEFILFDAYTYVYDYCDAPGFRVTSGALPNISDNIYFKDVFTGIDKDMVDWSKVIDYEVNPSFAFVKTYDGDVTDVVFFCAE